MNDAARPQPPDADPARNGAPRDHTEQDRAPLRLYQTPTRFFEREEEIYALQLGLAMAEHVLLLGPPGTAKSGLIDAMTAPLGLRRFSLLMGEYTKPEEVFGPLRISGLREDRYERVLDGYFCTADVAFLDEVFKGSSAIVNSLLRAMNERLYDNGGTQVALPLKTLVAASNEWPKGDASLEAAYDRFLIRRCVRPVGDETALLTGEGTRWRDAPTDTPVAADLSHIEVPRDVLVLVGEAARKVKEQDVTISDRRLLACRRVLQAAALLDGRDRVTPADILALRFVLWVDPDDAELAEKTLYHVVVPEVAECRQLVAHLERQASDLAGTTALNEQSMELMSALNTAHERIERHQREAVDPALVQPYAARLLALKKEIMDRYLNLG